VIAATVLRLGDRRLLGFSEYGDPAGAPVLAFHGTPGSRLQLAVLDGAARAVGVRLIVPDRPGYGLSDPEPDRRLADWPADVRAIADHLSLDRFAVLGVSGGAPHALACAAADAGRVTRVAVVSGVAPPDCWVASGRSSRLEKAVALLMRTGGPLLRTLVAVGLGAARRAPTALLWAYRFILPPADRAVLATPEVRTAAIGELRRQGRTTAAAVVRDLQLFSRAWGFDVQRIDLPVDIWHGDEDRAVPLAHARALAALLPQVTLHTEPGGGHFVLVACARVVLGHLAGGGADGRMTGPGPSEASTA
jgi:pimeloyl-ACP methyl ester carboxylesterase